MNSIGKLIWKSPRVFTEILRENGKHPMRIKPLWASMRYLFNPRSEIALISTFRDWPTALLSDRLYGNAVLEFELKDGSKIAARNRTMDKSIILEIWNYNRYTPPGFEINEQDIVVDIGAHIGCFSIFASTRANKGKVFSIEPTKENFEMLLRNISLNKRGNILPINKAIFNHKGQRRLFLSKDNTGGHSLYEEFDKSTTGRERESTVVDTISLSDLIEEHGIGQIDFLKIDCEGAEYEILYGSTNEAIQRVRKISMEYHDLDDAKRNAKALSEFLIRKGFEVSIITDPRKGAYLYAKR